jgi:hypothetical protein
VRHRLSMSRLGIAHACSYGFRGDIEVFPREVGRAAKVGSAVHALVEAAVTGHSDLNDVDPTVLAEAKAIFAGPLSGFVAGKKWTVCEKGYRYDSALDICTDGPRRGEPGYEDVAPSVLPGTVDLVEVIGDFADVVDVKTGKPPTDSEQLCGQAVAVSRRFGVKTVRIRYVRALKTKIDILNEETLDADRLDAEAGRIARVLRKLPVSQPKRGEYCWKCDARAVCPEWKSDDYYVDPDPPDQRMYSDDVRLF